jgi:N-methylhydantoinase B/oxoprolinase/acetone carboxylase alpha subunit
MDAIQLNIFSSRLSAIAEQMGAMLKRAAFSPNIKDRLDFSCALFDAEGELCAQAAHIPVHLGSMAYTMKDLVSSFDWTEGDMVVFNNPFRGGTHLPDVWWHLCLWIHACRVLLPTGRTMPVSARPHRVVCRYQPSWLRKVL